MVLRRADGYGSKASAYCMLCRAVSMYGERTLCGLEMDCVMPFKVA